MEANLEPLKEDVLKTLRAGETTVRFTKVDGSEREMRCTLSEGKIPSDKQPKTKDSSTAGSAIRVFDLDKGEWRSFRLESLISYK
jgi:hypothetical protein